MIVPMTCTLAVMMYWWPTVMLRLLAGMDLAAELSVRAMGPALKGELGEPGGGRVPVPV